MLTARKESDILSSTSSVLRPASVARRSTSQRIHRACDRCRVKKSKCNGQQPCNTCSLNQRTCVFSALRRRDIRKWHCRMQDSVDEAIQRLYRACRANGCFPGVPPSGQDGLPTTEDILIAMGFGSVGLSPVLGALPAAPETRIDDKYIENHAQYIDRSVCTNGDDEALSSPQAMATIPPRHPIIHHISPEAYEPVQQHYGLTLESAADQAREAIPRWTASEQTQPQRYHHHHYQHDPIHRHRTTQTPSVVHRPPVLHTDVHMVSSNVVSPTSLAFEACNGYLVSPYVVYSNGLLLDAQQAWHAHNTLLSAQP